MQLVQNTKLKPQDFVRLLYPYAKETERKTGISALATLAQAALESGWNSSSPGWMFFGVKDKDGLNGNEQLLRTIEYSRYPNLKFPEIISVTPVVKNGQKYFKYIVMDWFRKYESPEECFTDHANFFFRSPRYARAVEVRNNPYLFVQEIAKAGYATDPQYADLLSNLIHRIEFILNELNLN